MRIRPERPPLRPLLLGLALLCFCADPAPAVFGDGEDAVGDPVLVEIRIEGNTRTRTDYVLHEMGLEIGRPLTRERMDQAWDHLEDLGCFAYVDMEYDGFEPGEVVLVVSLEEEDTLVWGPLLRYSQRHKYLAGAWIEESNLRGRGEKLRADASAFYIQRLGLAWKHPWLLGRRELSIGAGAAAEQANFVYRPFRYRKADFDLALRWEAERPYFLVAGLGAGVFRIRDDFVDREPSVTTVAADTQPIWSARLAAGVDTRTNPHYPSHGVYAEAQTRRWESPDFDGYTELALDLRGYLPLPGGHHLLALRAWGRQVDGPAHLDNLCFWGGAQTVRGQHPARRQGDEAYLLTAEYRLPITMMRISPKGDLAGVGLHAFADAGDAWWDGRDPGSALRSWGAGIHLNLDRRQLRFEAAKTRQDGWTFEFGDGMTF